MRYFMLYLIGFLLLLVPYTLLVIASDGINLLPVFFGDIAKMAWPGQFNLDFLGFLGLSAIWTAWRHRFTATGFALAGLAFFGGMFYLSIYLLIQINRHRGDPQMILIGPKGGEAPTQ